MFPTPKRVFLTRGVATHRQQLSAFEYALRDADIEQQNLVSVSSILPPQCELIPRNAGVAALSPGEITFCVMARAETNEPGRRIMAGIGLARPKDSAHYGYISEHHGFGMSEEEASEYVEDLAATMLASTLGIERRTSRRLDLRRRGRGVPVHSRQPGVARPWSRLSPFRRHSLGSIVTIPKCRFASPAFRLTSARPIGPALDSDRPQFGTQAGCWSTATTRCTGSIQPRCR